MSSSVNSNFNRIINNEENNQHNIVDRQSQENSNAQSNQAQRHVIYQDNLSNVLEFNNNEINGDLETSIDLTDYAKYIPEDGSNQLLTSNIIVSHSDTAFVDISTEEEIAPASSEISEVLSDINVVMNLDTESSSIHANNRTESFDELTPDLLDEIRGGNPLQNNRSGSSSLVEINEENMSIRSKSSDGNEIENIEKITTYAIIETKKVEIGKRKDKVIQPNVCDKNVVNNDIVVIDKLSQLELSDDDESTTLLENHSKNNINNMTDHHENKLKENDKNLDVVGQTLLYLPKIDMSKSGGTENQENINKSTKYTYSPKKCEKSGKCSCCTIM
uniref:Uncharacterized protein n=1 Tax=Strongyloides papillosus TaxID=174720 RepID=A0A0N5B8A3_STREA